ncbi:putative F-box domain, kelch-type beta propeller, F-box-like domain superfamily [Helianthus annuus]|nr:putative F-box domain, kelch-type beta propeller, F-box-like domain superfamily [Helianthus annuus]
MNSSPSPSSSSSSSSESPQQTLIPGLPYDLAALILSFLPYPYHGTLKSICKSWNHFFSSRFYHSIRHKHIPFPKTSHLLCIFPQDPSVCSPYIFDPIHKAWSTLPLMPRFRAGCVGFMVGGEEEFWVMGGYGESRTILGVFPVDEYYRDAAVMRLDNGGGGAGKWRSVGDMWEEGERRQLGRIAVVEDGGAGCPDVFMLDKNDIFRYDMNSNRWWKETTLPKRAIDESAVGFVALNGELHVMATHNGAGSVENRRLRRHKRLTSLFIQVYHPGKRIWRTLTTQPPFQQPLDFKTAVMCTIRL